MANNKVYYSIGSWEIDTVSVLATIGTGATLVLAFIIAIIIIRG